MAVKNAVYKVDNGAGAFDEIMFKTKAEQVVFKDNTNLENRFKNLLTITGEGSQPWTGEKEGIVELSDKIGLAFGYFYLGTWETGTTNSKRDYEIPKAVSSRIKNVLGPVLCISDCQANTCGWCAAVYNAITKTIYCRVYDMAVNSDTTIRYLMLVELN